MSKNIHETVKAATVAIALVHPDKAAERNRPFTIIGSGFCVHSKGVVITCEHVFKAFIDQKAYKKLLRKKEITPISYQYIK